MPNISHSQINDYLVMIFNEVNMIEENSLKQSQFSDLSIKEMHTIEAIGLNGADNSSEIAAKLGVTLGTMSVSIQNLVRKGYVLRAQSPTDRRVVRLQLTKRGRLLFRLHRQFHLTMVEQTLSGLSKEEVKVLIKGLHNLHSFLDETKHRL